MTNIIQKRPNGSRRVITNITKGTKTEQTHKKACDINTIMAKVRKGQAVPVSRQGAMYGDFSDVGDFVSVQEKILQAHEEFNGLSSQIRKRFRNDPAQLIAFLQDPENEQEAIELGILARDEVVPPVEENEAEAETPVPATDQ